VFSFFLAVKKLQSGHLVLLIIGDLNVPFGAESSNTVLNQVIVEIHDNLVVRFSVATGWHSLCDLTFHSFILFYFSLYSF
jgi:hypothetical protein